MRLDGNAKRCGTGFGRGLFPAGCLNRSVTLLTILLLLPTCVPPARDIPAPANPGDLWVTVTNDTPTIPAGTAVTLESSATGGEPPFTFRWDQNGTQPAAVELDAVNEATLTTPPLTTTGRYVFRVTVTDADGLSGSDFTAIEVIVPFTVTAKADDAEVFEGAPVALTVEVGAEAREPVFVWRLAEGPDDVRVDLSGESAAEITTPPLVVAGGYTFEVTVTDARGLEVSGTVSVDVLAAVSIADPHLALAGMPIGLIATIATDAEGITSSWEITEGAGTLTGADTLTPMLTTQHDESVMVRLSLMVPVPDGDAAVVTRDVRVISITDLTPQVVIETNFGDFTLELDAELAPGHTENFLRYVDEGFYDGVLFHRNACVDDPDTGQCAPFVLQGGGYERVDGELELKEPTHEAIASESDNGLSNSELYSVALALSGSNSSTGRAQFFINLDDNRFLDEAGFTVFGRVVTGREVVDALAAMPRRDNPTIPGEVSLPAEDVIMFHVER